MTEFFFAHGWCYPMRRLKNTSTFLKSLIFIISVAFCILSMASNSWGADSPISKPPNIIFILADDMGYSDMGWQGSPIQTPNLDKLREGGMYLERCYAQPQCSPSRAALLTGRYPYRSGFHEHIILPWSFTGLPGPMSSITVSKPKSNDEKSLSFPEDRKSIAQKLKEAGYKTAIIGKWHLGSHFQSYLPHNQGFDYSFVALEGEISYWNYTHYGRSNIIENGKKFYAKSMEDNETSGNTYATDLWAEKAVEVIRHHDPKHPLFMYLPITAPHWPLQAPQKFLDKYPLENIPGYWAGANATNKRTAENRRIYMAMVDAMDASIGTIIQSLKDQGMLDNTLIIFSSDNGGIPESDNRPLRSVKGDSFEGGVRVPCIVFWPQKIKPGSTSSELVHIADWYPTFAELAGLKVDDKHLDGMSVTSLLEGGSGLRQQVPIVSEGRHALITPTHSLVGGGSNYQELLSQNLSKFQMYDLKADPSQKKPTSDYPEIAKAMRDSMKEHFEQLHRGYFNWDVTHNQDRLEKIKSDHAYDSVVNDLPQLTAMENAGFTTISISPVSEELTYQLQKSADGMNWSDIASHVAKSNAKEFTFPAFPAPQERMQYRVKTERHMGLPMREAFADLKPGSAFISRNDKTGNVDIAQESLVFGNWPSEAGSLLLSVDKMSPLASLSLYSIEPYSRGKIYTAMFLKLEAKEGDHFGEINYLQMNGLKDTTKAATLTLKTDGIYLDSASAVPRQAPFKIAPYDGGVVYIVLEFDFGTTNKDTLKIYVNPNSDQLTKPVAQIKGEFTFDRLQFQLSAQNDNAQMQIDELRIGRSWEELRTP